MVIIEDPSVTVNCRTTIQCCALTLIFAQVKRWIVYRIHVDPNPYLLLQMINLIFRMTLETVTNISVANTVSTTVTDKMVQPPSSDTSSSRPNNIVNMYTKLYENEWTDTLDTLTQSGKRWAMDLVIKHLYIVLNVIQYLLLHRLKGVKIPKGVIGIRNSKKAK